MTSVKLQHTRRIRHRKFKGLDRGTSGVSRNTKLTAFLDQSVDDMDSSGTVVNFTADFANDEIDSASHGLSTGDGPYEFTTTTTLPDGLQLLTAYWFSAVDTEILQAHLTRNEAFLGLNPVAMADAGTGTHSYEPFNSQRGLLAAMQQAARNTPEVVQGETDIDNLIP